MATSEEEFKKHFEARAAAARAKQTEADATAQQREALRAAVVEKMDKAVRPVMERFRDLLLEQNLPAEVQFLPHVENADARASITLRCSGVLDYSRAADDWDFLASYALQDGQLKYRTTNPEGKPVLRGHVTGDVPIAFADLTAEDANRRLMAFIKSAFPA